MKISASHIGKALWSLAGVMLASVISLPGSAQGVPGNEAQQTTTRGQGESPIAFYHLVYTLTESD